MRHSRITEERHDDSDFRPAETVLHVTQTIGRPEPVADSAAPSSAPRRFGIAALKQIFGGTKKLTADAIGDKIAALRAEIAAAESQQRAASDKLARPGLLSDAEHERAEADVAAAHRAIIRAKDVILGLEAERAVLTAAEAKTAFLAEVEAAKLRAAEAKRRLQTEYAPAAKLIAGILTDLKASQAEIIDLMRQGRDFGEAVAIESPLAAFGAADTNVSIAVAAQRSNLLTDISLPALGSGADIVPPSAELARRLPRLT